MAGFSSDDHGAIGFGRGGEPIASRGSHSPPAGIWTDGVGVLIGPDRPVHQDGYYWYKADGVDIIRALRHRGESLTEACSAQVGHVMPHGDNRGEWVTGCVYAAKGGNQP